MGPELGAGISTTDCIDLCAPALSVLLAPSQYRSCLEGSSVIKKGSSGSMGVPSSWGKTCPHTILFFGVHASVELHWRAYTSETQLLPAQQNEDKALFTKPLRKRGLQQASPNASGICDLVILYYVPYSFLAMIVGTVRKQIENIVRGNRKDTATRCLLPIALRLACPQPGAGPGDGPCGGGPFARPGNLMN